ncbi:hypothetical protein DENIS_3028 [Desulfonema ishimotonii]|uniref:PH domain-containing protein n=1 Tax=Desulfonema ishimotonii TaxID=45657 RepID=A0A401FYM8_9BACT|nr:hypothetical protein [Desulfonema ishimotonii]GBC62065.1 hypothetical protein DENIS_3028 [Desulfonema ishimotonii]
MSDPLAKPVGRSVHIGACFRVGSYVILGFSVCIMPGFVRQVIEASRVDTGYVMLLFFIFAIVMSLPLIVADMFIAEYIVDSSGIEKKGLFNRRTKIFWEDVTRIRFERPTSYLRDIIIYSKGKKFAFSCGLFFYRKCFWDGARLIVKYSEAYKIPLKSPEWFGGLAYWFKLENE